MSGGWMPPDAGSHRMGGRRDIVVHMEMSCRVEAAGRCILSFVCAAQATAEGAVKGAAQHQRGDLWHVACLQP